MKSVRIFLCILIFTLFTFGCSPTDLPNAEDSIENAADYGLSPENEGIENSKILQALIDALSEKGGTVYIPAGEYEFAENGSQRIGTHCIKMRSNVHIVGDGTETVLKPVGDSYAGLDMFYFNDYLDLGEAVYLENCRFENFVIDGSQTSCNIYTSAGKGFMFNLFRNCHWKNVTVKNTDATGFGVDCPIDCSMTDCIAIGCGKGATVESTGASGFGIGFGFSEQESIRITGCTSLENRKFGFFFEHQGIFNDDLYEVSGVAELLVADCVSKGNLYNYGGIMSRNTVYEDCLSSEALRYGFYFEDSSTTKAENCVSENDGWGGFAIRRTEADCAVQSVPNVTLSHCVSRNQEYGVKIIGADTSECAPDIRVNGCVFKDVDCPVYAEGILRKLCLQRNESNRGKPFLCAQIEDFVDEENSWNKN